MKRCLQCEFIYEDDQRVCDMDGSKLAVDSRPLPNLQALYNDPSVTGAKRKWKGHTVPAFASLILAAVLFLFYQVSIHQPAHQNFVAPPQVVTESAQPTAPNPLATNSTSNTRSGAIIETDIGDNRVEVPRTSPGNTGIANANRSGATHTPKEALVRKPNRNENQKPAESANNSRRNAGPASIQRPVPVPRNDDADKDSKIGSLLKKTGRLLKKPFRL
jgi:hypothetical protein